MASRLAVLLLVLLLVLVGAVGLAAALRFRNPSMPGAGVVLVLELPASISEARPLTNGFSLSRFRREEPTLWDLTFAIRHAAHDRQVRSLVVHVDGIDWGWARAAELRAALAEFRASGKPLFVALRGGGEHEYLIASSGGTLAMPATATLQLDGLTASAMFLKGTYDKLGIHPNFEHIGAFKSAVESYTRTGMSPEARTALEALLDDEYSVLVDSLAIARGVGSDSLRRLIDAGPFLARRAQACGLVDTLLEQAELDSLAVQRAGSGVKTMRFERYQARIESSSPDAPIALLVASGTIVSGRSHSSPWDGDQLGGETLVSQLRDLRERESVEAVVLRIDSPGGDGGASEEVWREVRRLSAVKPVIVSMSDLAASGGYYIACAADSIVAEPGTLTGSIGVFGGKLNVLGLYQKVGLNIETVSRGRHAEMFSPFRDFTPEESERFRSQLADFYQVFLSRVSEGRGLTTADVDSIGQGRVWSGLAAKRLGLVDELGGLDRALEIAARRAGLPASAERRPVRFVPEGRTSFFDQWLAGLVDEDDEAFLERLTLPVELQAWQQAARFRDGAVLALMPFQVQMR